MVFNQFSFNSINYIKKNTDFFKPEVPLISIKPNPLQNWKFYTSCRLSRTQKCFAVAAIKLFNRLPEEIKSLPGGQFQCYMKTASQLATVLPEINRSFSSKLVTYESNSSLHSNTCWNTPPVFKSIF